MLPMKSAKLSKRMRLSAQGSIRTERTENRRVINACVGSGRSRYPAISLQSAEVAIPKSDLKSAAYEIRTKSAKSGALETNGRRAREFRVTAGVSKCGGFRAKPVVIGLLCGLATRRGMLVAIDWRRERNWDPTVSEFVGL
jgi:hypothetical protein